LKDVSRRKKHCTPLRWAPQFDAFPQRTLE
jgi:hypothetical protein